MIGTSLDRSEQPMLIGHTARWSPEKRLSRTAFLAWTGYHTEWRQATQGEATQLTGLRSTVFALRVPQQLAEHITLVRSVMLTWLQCAMATLVAAKRLRPLFQAWFSLVTLKTRQVVAVLQIFVVQRALQHWQAAGMQRFRLASAREEFITAAKRLKATWAIRRLRLKAVAARVEQELQRIARCHSHGALLKELKGALDHWNWVVFSKAAKLQKIGEAIQHHSRALVWKAFSSWRVDPKANERAMYQSRLVFWRSWCECVQQERVETKTIEENVLRASRRCLSRAAWHAWKMEAKRRILTRAVGLERVVARSLWWLRCTCESWHCQAFLQRRGRNLLSLRQMANLSTLMRSWQWFVRHKHEIYERSRVFATCVRAKRQAHVMGQWQLLIDVRLFCYHCEQKNLWRVISNCLACWKAYSAKKSYQELQRRKFTRWRYLKLLSKGLSAMKFLIRQKCRASIFSGLAAKARSLHSIKCSIHAWSVVARPSLQVRARQHRHVSLKRQVSREWKLYLASRKRKLQEHDEARMFITACKLGLAWRRLRVRVRARIQHRHQILLSTFRCRRNWLDTSRRRALRKWQLQFVPRTLKFKSNLDRAACQYATRLYGNVLRSLLWWMSLQHTQSQSAATKRALMRQSHLRKLLQQWQYAVLEQQRVQKQHQEALLQWYAVLCSSVLLIWRTWFSRRQRVKDRQSQAFQSFLKAQQTSAIRTVLWCFNERKDEEEASVTACCLKAHHQRIERASNVAQHWRAFAHGRTTAGTCASVNDSMAAGKIAPDSPGLTDASSYAHWLLEALPDCSSPSFTTVTTAPLTKASPDNLRTSWTPSLSDSWDIPLHEAYMSS